jgi:hypothetical protein
MTEEIEKRKIDRRKKKVYLQTYIYITVRILKVDEDALKSRSENLKGLAVNENTNLCWN